MIGLDKAAAILSLVPKAEFVIREDVVEWHSPSIAPVSDEQIAQELTRLQQQHEADEYKRKRQAEYPPLTDQLDTIFHNGLDAWKAQIQAVKDKYPKAT
jgi:hypothetical protein